jgi:hypothetical protein
MVLDVAVVLAAFLLVAGVAGVVWPHLVAPVEVTRTEGGLSTGEIALGNQFDRDAWYSVLAFGGGLFLGVTMSAWRRSHEVVTLLAVVAGSLLAAWVSARVGRQLGPEDPARVLAHAKAGATALDQVVVTAHAAYLVWPISALIGALVVLWSPPGRSLVHHD